MISFFFATMVALTMSSYNLETNVLESNNLTQVYDSSNTLVGLSFDSDDVDSQILGYYSNTLKNEKTWYIQTGIQPIGFKTILDYASAAGGVTSYISLKVQSVGESISTNLYLSDIHIHFSTDGANYYHDFYPNDIYFRGQSYYVDDFDGDYTFDIEYPYSLSSSTHAYINFVIRCEDATLQEGKWYNNGYNDGYEAGYTEGDSTGYNNGYNVGYDDGYQQGYSTDSTVTSIFSGILQVALVPINFFLAIFNFDILGINISGFIKALFTIAITIIVIRTIFGGKGAGDGGD